MRNLIISIFFSLGLIASPIELKDYRVRCIDIFSDSGSPNLTLYEFNNPEDELRVFGVKTKEWAAECKSNSGVNKSELTVSTLAKIFSEEEIESKLKLKLKKEVHYNGPKIWSAYGLEDLSLFVRNGNIFIKTNIEEKKVNTLLIEKPHYKTLQALRSGQVISAQTVVKETFLSYDTYLKIKPMENPIGLVLAQDLPIHSAIEENNINQIIVEAGSDLRVLVEVNDLEIETTGQLAMKSKIGDIVKVKMKNHKVLQGHLVSSNLVKVVRE